MNVGKNTDCFFQDIFGRRLEIAFNQERTTSDGGAVLLLAADRRLNLVAALNAALQPKRQPGKVVHNNESLLSQRIFSIACGYPDTSDAARLGHDPLMRLLAGGDENIHDLASQPTICRFENSLSHRDLYRLGDTLVDVVIANQQRRRKGFVGNITIDLDPTVDPTHGDQQLTFFNGFYDCHCYLPMIGFVQFDNEPEQHLVAAVLRPGNSNDRKGACAILRRLIPKLKTAFPRAVIRVRLDGGFASEEILALIESFHGLQYAINMPKNSILIKKSQGLMRKVRKKFRKKQAAVRLYGECRYAAKKWSRKRRVIMKAEIVTHPGREPRENPRFLITNMRGSPRRIYEDFYCLRGDAENRIKELKNSVALDRTSCSNFRANQFRVLLSAAAYVLLQEIRHCAGHTRLAQAQAPRIIMSLIKLGARVTISVRRIRIELPRSVPAQSEWLSIARNLGALAA